MPLVAEVTSSRQALEARTLRRATGALLGPMPTGDGVGVAVSFSYSGLKLFSNFEGPTDAQFRGGAGAAAEALLDEVDAASRPIGWDFGSDETSTPHILVILAGVSDADVQAKGAEIVKRLDPVAMPILRESGVRLRQDREHFGFVDGISQPAPRGTVNGKPLIERTFPEDHADHSRYARPGQPLVWPGQFVFGYPTQEPESGTPGPEVGADDILLRNGSLLVFRKLRQHVAAFRLAMQKLAADFTTEGLPVDEHTAAAWCVGRWPDGTPVSLSPVGESLTLSGDTTFRNGFLFREDCGPTSLTVNGATVAFPGARGDKFGHACPFFSHIRKVNPRDTPVELGSDFVTLKSQMLRRGITYGPPWTAETDKVDRGLLFLSYQTSIEHQFHRLMTNWVNDAFAPPQPQGVDPLIGATQGGKALTRRPADNRNYRATVDGRWVTTVGAGYFFTPGINALRLILEGDSSEHGERVS